LSGGPESNVPRPKENPSPDLTTNPPLLGETPPRFVAVSPSG